MSHYWADNESDDDTQRYDNFDRNRRRGHRGYNGKRNFTHRKPQTDNGVVFEVELDRDLVAAVKRAAVSKGHKTVYQGIREACYEYARKYAPQDGDGSGEASENGKSYVPDESKEAEGYVPLKEVEPETEG